MCGPGQIEVVVLRQGRQAQNFGEVSERFKEHAWKVCVRQKRTEGSNPSLSAITQAGGCYPRLG